MAIRLRTLAAGWLPAVAHASAGVGAASDRPGRRHLRCRPRAARASRSPTCAARCSRSPSSTRPAPTPARCSPRRWPRSQRRLGSDFGPRVASWRSPSTRSDTPERACATTRRARCRRAGLGLPHRQRRRRSRRSCGATACSRRRPSTAAVDHMFLTSLVDREGTLRVQYLGTRFDPARCCGISARCCASEQPAAALAAASRGAHAGHGAHQAAGRVPRHRRAADRASARSASTGARAR